MIKLNEIITSAQYIGDLIKQAYDNIIQISNKNPVMSEGEALGIGYTIYYYIHVLLDQYVSFKDLETATNVINKVLTHNTIQIVNEIRQLVNVANNQTKLGITHNKTNFHPFNNSDLEANLTNTDIQSYNDLNNIILARDFVLDTNKHIRELFAELYDCLITSYEGY